MSAVEIKVRGYHADAYGHVNNARYLEFLEEGRWALFEEAGEPTIFADRGWAFFVVNVNVNFRKPAGPGDLLRVETRLVSLGRKSGLVAQVIRRGEEVVLDAEVRFCIADKATGRALPLEGEVREALGRLG